MFGCGAKTITETPDEMGRKANVQEMETRLCGWKTGSVCFMWWVGWGFVMGLVELGTVVGTQL